MADKEKSGWIDIHAHFLPNAYLEAMQLAGIAGAVHGFPLSDWSRESALDAMDRYSISTALLSISAPGLAFLADEAEARRVARSVNETHAEIVGRHPYRFGGFALLPLPFLDVALQEMEFALDTLRLDGIVLFSNINGVYLGDQRLDPLFSELNRRKAVVFVHPTAPPHFNIGELRFPAPTLEYPTDTTRMMMNLISSGTMRRYPEVKIIVGHGGGVLPFLAPRLARHMSRFIDDDSIQTEDDVFAAFRSFYYDLTAVSHPYALDALLKVAGKERLLYGTDFPFLRPDSAIEAQRCLESYSDLAGETLAGLRYENAVKLFPRLSR